MRRTLPVLLAAFALSTGLAACISPGTVKERLDVVEDVAACGTPARTLLVLLPGLYDTPADLVRQGFTQAVRERRLAADIVMADAHFGYYKAGVIVRRLHEDIILPAREKGYRQIWLAGISLGGYGALHYAREHGELVAGVMAIAPYLGDDKLIAELKKAGGLSSWQAGDVAGDDHGRRLWAWLKGIGGASRPDTAAYPGVFLGYGTADRFAGSNRMLADVLPAARVMTTDGGHDWSPWRRVWAAFLDRSSLPACA